MMDSICIYKDKINEAITLIPSMSGPKKLEAVSYWNSVASYIQDIVNQYNSQLRDENHQHQPPHQDTTSANKFETHVDTRLETSPNNTDDEINEISTESVIEMALDIDANDSSQQFEGFMDDPLFGNARNLIEETAQGRTINVTLDAIGSSSSSRLTEASQQPNSLIDFNDTSPESGQEIPLDSLVQISSCDQQAIMDSTNPSCILAPTCSTSTSTNQLEELVESTRILMQNQSFCTPLDNASSQVDLAIGSSDSAIDAASNIDNQNILMNQSFNFNRSSSDNSQYTVNNQIAHDVCNGQFDRGPESSMVNRGGGGNNDCSQHPGETPISFVDTCSSMGPCTNTVGHDSQPLQQIQIYPSDTQSANEFLITCANPTGQLVEFSLTQQQASSNCLVSQPSILSSEILNYASSFPQQQQQQQHQSAKAPANIDCNSHAESDKSLHTCEVCGKSGFSTKGNLKRHRKAHTGEKPFHCDYCSTRFTEKKSLKIHLRKHTGEKPYKCEICDQLFSQTAVLKSHMMSLHLDERKFVCHKCDKAFKQSSQLKLHLMRHDGIKKLGCSACQARFLTKGDLERHFRVHTGERPYSCRECGKAFTRQQSLNEHLNRHYGKKPFTCKHCGKDFSEMSACYKVMSYSRPIC